MDIQTLKERRKGYTTAFGYCSCREDDLDWLIKQAEVLDELVENMTSIVGPDSYLSRIFDKAKGM